MRTPLSLPFVLLAVALTPAVAQTISATDAKSHVGEKVIEAKSDDGIYIELGDGTKWLVVKVRRTDSWRMGTRRGCGGNR